MALTNKEKLKAIKISRAIEQHLHEIGKTMVRSTDVYEYLARKGLVERDNNNGIHLRRFLKKLKREGALDLIPQCDGIDQDEIFTNWYFHSAGEKAIRSIVVKQSESVINRLTTDEIISNLRKLAAGLNPLSGEAPDDISFLSNWKVRESLLYAIDNLEKQRIDVYATAEIVDIGNTEEEKGKDVKIQYKTNEEIKVGDLQYDIGLGTQKMLETVAETINSLPLIKDSETLPPYLRNARKRYRRAYEAWSEEEDRILLRIYEKVKDTGILSIVFQRGEKSLVNRLEKLKG
jgi:hypothetical protein